ncbi:pentatricopeptide repeat-containing protein At5g46460, mitochondrial-like [Prosopis cineraria]|uniref:pentatricopeptide repeat-containing protein At5g46460, mitochondrial-like n=1 Tax=Prosopis cineraria TaxID=364024 RepID=UPI00240F1AD6|nr:pentatricopeptide repeat-containing protein At5g46460, mitochondrial-like [Prosopis cineraria]
MTKRWMAMRAVCTAFVKFIYIPTSISFAVIRNCTTSATANSLSGFKCVTSNSKSSSYKHLLSHHLKNQSLDEARIVFDKIPTPSVALYTMMVMGYAQNHRLSEALNLFEEMPYRDVVSWNSMIKGCLDCGDFIMAKKLFDEMPKKNVISWTTIMNGLLQLGRVKDAERFFHKMPYRDVATWNAMIHGYCCNGRIEEALLLFEGMPTRNVISWTSMISGLDQNGKSDEALLLYQKMVSLGMHPTSTTLVCGLSAASKISALHAGLQIQCHIFKLGYCLDEYVYASLVTFYANCKQMKVAHKVFHDILHENVVVWTALLSGYALNNEHEHAIKVFREMMKQTVFPNEFSLTSALNSCCGLEDMEKGREIHVIATKLGLVTNTYVGNSLVVMYSKCGYINDGIIAFKKISEKNIVSWNSAIVGCAQHGCGMWALIVFKQMLCERVDPDEITLTGLLSACSHSGMLQKARCFFKYFEQKLSELTVEHYTCMVDVLGRCGELDEAEALARSLPMKANSMVWLVLLGACRMHSNLDVAERAAKEIFELEPDSSAAYVLLSNLYASASRWSEVARIRKMMKHKGVSKQPGSSWVSLKGWRHEFLTGDRSHPLSEKIYQKLDWLGVKLKELGYVPDQQFALHDVETEQREEMLSYHSERLAIAFGLLNTMEGSTITVMKNLRTCGDCHNAIKLIAKIVDREIIVRDSSRFHHFKDGTCSCGDYW